MAKKARKDEIEKAAPRNPAMSRKRKRKVKRKSGASTATSGLCDDLISNIFVRLPARTLVASMALSKHHRRMILCPEFRSLHCSLGPPLPLPNVAYIATAMISRRQSIVSSYHSFHVAGRAGLSRGRAAPTRSLTGSRYLNMKYINTCNGVLLFADSRRCVFLNPCVAKGDKEVAIPTGNDHCVLGFGYGKRTQTYKILLSRKCDGTSSYDKYPRDLLVYSPRDNSGEQPQVRTLLSGKQEGDRFFYKPHDSSTKVFINSLYIDGIVYLLHIQKRVIFAFDVDDETVTTINLPGNGYMPNDYYQMYRLMEVSGRPCIETSEWKDKCRCHILWLLTVDHQWEEMCVIKKQDGYERCFINGVWECGGALALHLNGVINDPNMLYLLSSSSTMNMFRTNLPPNLKPLSEYAFCWGYKPTLVPPGSIIGELDQEEKKTQGHTTDIIKAVKRLNKQEKRTGREATANVVCLMKLLAGVMSRLPENMQEAILLLLDGLSRL